MIYTIPTKKGLGIELWGTYSDLECLHDVVGNFWGNEDFETIKGFASREMVIRIFSYEIRKAFQECREISKQNHYTLEPAKYLGTKISWPHMLFSLSAIRFNMRFYQSNKRDLSILMYLDYCLEKSMIKFDPVGADKLKRFMSGGIDADNEYLYQFYRNIEVQYFRFSGGKRAFRRLPDLLEQAISCTRGYDSCLAMLKQEAKRLNCGIESLEINSSDIDYENMKW